MARKTKKPKLDSTMILLALTLGQSSDMLGGYANPKYFKSRFGPNPLVENKRIVLEIKRCKN